MIRFELQAGGATLMSGVPVRTSTGRACMSARTDALAPAHLLLRQEPIDEYLDATGQASRTTEQPAGVHGEQLLRCVQADEDVAHLRSAVKLTVMEVV